MTRPRTVLGLLALPGGVVLTAALSDGARRLLSGSTTSGGDPADAIAGLAAGLAALIATWLTLCLALALVAELPGAAGAAARRVRDRITPVLVRRWAAIVLGASVTATVVPGTAAAAVRPTTDPAPGSGRGGEAAAPSPGWTPGSAAPAPTTLPVPPGTAVPTPGWAPGTPTRTVRPRGAAPAPGWVPHRPPARYRGDPHLVTGRHRGAGDEQELVVRRGDTLWSIAAARLGPDATDAEIARAWPRWHAANSAVIGSDPHRLLPGTLLTPPSSD